MDVAKNQVEYTQEEKDIAKEYAVEPKLIKMLKDIVEKYFEQEPPEKAQPAEPCISQQTMNRIRNYYKNLDPKTKLAILTLSELRCLDGINFQARQPREERLCILIEDDLESVCVKTFHDITPVDVAESSADLAFGKVDCEDIWLAGIWEAVRMMSQNC